VSVRDAPRQQAPLVFLDANVLFSTALGGPTFVLLMDLARAGRVRLTTSLACREEAFAALSKKRPDSRAAFHDCILQLAVRVGIGAVPAWVARALPPKDHHVLTAALESGAGVLLTGDREHFGALMQRLDLPIAVRTVRAFIEEGP
jgi:predicted nucleic acid-binding protein